MFPVIIGLLFTATFMDIEVDEPHELIADTVISPVATPVVTLIVLVVEVPVQPVGKVHKYDEAPATAATE